MIYHQPNAAGMVNQFHSKLLFRNSDQHLLPLYLYLNLRGKIPVTNGVEIQYRDYYIYFFNQWQPKLSSKVAAATSVIECFELKFSTNPIFVIHEKKEKFSLTEHRIQKHPEKFRSVSATFQSFINNPVVKSQLNQQLKQKYKDSKFLEISVKINGFRNYQYFSFLTMILMVGY